MNSYVRRMSLHLPIHQILLVLLTANFGTCQRVNLLTPFLVSAHSSDITHLIGCQLWNLSTRQLVNSLLVSQPRELPTSTLVKLVNLSARQLSLSFLMSANRCSTATSCGIFFSTQTCFL